MYNEDFTVNIFLVLHNAINTLILNGFILKYTNVPARDYCLRGRETKISFSAPTTPVYTSVYIITQYNSSQGSLTGGNTIFLAHR